MSQLGEGTDWQDQIFRTAPIHSHNVSVNGGSENTKFAVVASYFGQEGVVKNQDFNRVSLRNNIDTKISKVVDLSTSLTISRVFANTGRENGDGGGNTSIINASLVMPPTVPIYDPTTGEYVRLNYLPGSSTVPNPVPYVKHLQDKGTIDRILASADLTFHIIDGLTLKSVEEQICQTRHVKCTNRKRRTEATMLMALQNNKAVEVVPIQMKTY